MTPQQYSVNEQKIHAVLKNGNANKINQCAAILRIIDQAEDADRAALIRFAAELIEMVKSNHQGGSNDDLILITDNEKERLQERFGKISDEMLKALIAENLEESIFYQKLWGIVNNPFFSESNAREFVFYNLLMDSQIPYFKVDDGLRMSNDEFQKTLGALFSLKAEVRFLLKRDFDQRTQRASNLLDLFDKVTDRNEKVVLMAYLLGQCSNSIDELALLRALQKATR